MSPRDDYAVKIVRYLDDDLVGNELHEFCVHAVSCAKWQADLKPKRRCRSSSTEFAHCIRLPRRIVRTWQELCSTDTRRRLARESP